MASPLRISPAFALETDRMRLRRVTAGDSPFIMQLLNDPAWLRFIGDKGIRTDDDARDYIRKGPVAMYERVGFGLYLTEHKDDGEPMGLCGLIKRDALDDVDLGFAFLPRFRVSGYAFEAASAVLAHGKADFGLKRVVAITSPDNARSILLLDRLGFEFEKMVRLADDGEELRLHARAM